MCGHLARSGAFLIFEVADGRIASQSVRERFQENCGRHATFIELAEGCSAVLCGGIGQGAADALAAHGIEPVVVVGEHTAEAAVELYLKGILPTSNDRVCLCG